MDTSSNSWKELFCSWPVDLPPRGALVTTFGEQILFNGFLNSEALLLVQRQTPDSLGARTVIVPYGCVVGLKLVDVIKAKSFEGIGFKGSLPNS